MKRILILSVSKALTDLLNFITNTILVVIKSKGYLIGEGIIGLRYHDTLFNYAE